MSKKTVKILSILLTFVLVMVASASVFALTPNDIKASNGGEVGKKIKAIGQDIIGLLQVAGVVIAIAILIVIGIKYMMGSTADKAEYKKSLMPYLIGAVLIFGAVAISEVVYQMAISISTT